MWSSVGLVHDVDSESERGLVLQGASSRRVPSVAHVEHVCGICIVFTYVTDV